MPMTPFDARTYAYFDGARQNASDRAWFERHRPGYEHHIAKPFTPWVTAIGALCSEELPDLDISPRKIVKPVRRQAAGPDGAVVRANATAFLPSPPAHASR